MLPKAFDEEEAGSEREDEEERDESAYNDQEEETTEDYEQQQQIQKYLAERNFYRSETEHVMTRILPKIDEVDNENDESRCEEEEKPKSKAHRNLIGKLSDVFINFQCSGLGNLLLIDVSVGLFFN